MTEPEFTAVLVLIMLFYVVLGLQCHGWAISQLGFAKSWI